MISYIIEILTAIAIVGGIIGAFTIWLKIQYKRIPPEDMLLINKHYHSFKWYHTANFKERLLIATMKEADEKIDELKQLIKGSN